MPNLTLSKELLIEEINNNLSQKQIADKYNIRKSQVRKCLKHYNLNTQFNNFKQQEKKPESQKKKRKSDGICEYCGKKFDNPRAIGAHVSAVHHPNTNKKDTKRKISINSRNRVMSEETKNKISKTMKQAHQEGRAWNIGMSRWNNEPSHPEKFFMKVIKNEFDDQNYQHEYNFDIYSIDFAWPHKKKAIEIDGQQHQRFKEYQERDKRKDLILKENDWQILRIPFKSMYNNTKQWIKEAYDFIHSNKTNN